VEPEENCDEMDRTAFSMNFVWRWTLGKPTALLSNTLEAAEQGEAVPGHEGDKNVGEETPLLGGQRRPRLHLSIFQVLYQTLLAPIYAVLLVLPLLPFWIVTGFLVYLLLGTASSNHNFWVYCGCLTVLLPFNIVGTVAIVRRVWMDFYGD